MKTFLTSVNRLRSPLLAVSLMALAGGSAEAVVLDLTQYGLSGTINGAIYEQINPQSTGTGVINAFAQISGDGNSDSPDGQRHGYNTTVNNTLDNHSSDEHNRSITLADVPIVTIGGVQYRQFILDVNENSNANLDQFISLDEVQIFVGGTANSGVETFTGGVLDHDGALVYRMDAGSDSTVGLDYSLNAGSGSGDMFLYVLNSAFGAAAGTSVVTLYSHFGFAGNNPADLPAGRYGISDGFEEWAVLQGTTTTVPDGGASVALLGLALIGVGAFRKMVAKK